MGEGEFTRHENSPPVIQDFVYDGIGPSPFRDDVRRIAGEICAKKLASTLYAYLKDGTPHVRSFGHPPELPQMKGERVHDG